MNDYQMTDNNNFRNFILGTMLNHQNVIKYKDSKQTFLNCSVKVQLPSNLLTQGLIYKKQLTKSTDITRYKYNNMTEQLLQKDNYQYFYEHNRKYETEKIQASQQLGNKITTKYTTKSGQTLWSNVKEAPFFQSRVKSKQRTISEKQQSFTIQEQKSSRKIKKMSLHKKLCDVRSKTQQLKSLSLSKMLKQMVIIQDKDNSQQNNKFTHDIDKPSYKSHYYTPVQQKNYELRCKTTETRPSRRSQSKSNEKNNSKNLFNRFFVPPSANNSLKIQKSFLEQEADASGKYVIKNKKVECRRIHNFYTTDKFKKSYRRYIKNTIDSLRIP